MTASAFSILLGCILICIYAADRFNSPTTTRASTTAVRYYIAFTTYLLAYLFAYLLFLYNPVLLKQMFPDVEIIKQLGVEGDNLPILMALGFSMSIPKVPLLMQADRYIKKYLHRLASIPFEATRLSKEIQNLQFVVPEPLLPVLQDELDERHFSERAAAGANKNPLLKSWIKLTTLVLQLKRWEHDENFHVFMQDRSGQFKRILERYKSLTAATLSSDQLARQAEQQPQVASLQEAAERFQKNLQSEENTLFSDICDFISQGLLASCLLEQSRRAMLEGLGFIVPNKTRVESVSIHQITWLVLVLAVLLTASFVLLGAQMHRGIEIIMLRVAMIVSIYGVAVYITVNLKARWRWFQHHPGHVYPAASYLVAGLVAMSLAALIGVGFNMLVEMSTATDVNMGAAIGKAWGEFTTYRYPWLVMSCCAAMTLSFLIDFDRGGVVPLAWRNAANALIMAAVLMGACMLVYVWVQSLHQDSQRSFRLTLVSLLRNSSIIGCVIGYLVPAWFNARVDTGQTSCAAVPPRMTAATAALA